MSPMMPYESLNFIGDCNYMVAIPACQEKRIKRKKKDFDLNPIVCYTIGLIVRAL